MVRTIEGLLSLWQDWKTAFKIRPAEVDPVVGAIISVWLVFSLHAENYVEAFMRCKTWFEHTQPVANGQYIAVIKGKLDILWSAFGWMFTLTRDVLAVKMAIILLMAYVRGE